MFILISLIACITVAHVDQLEDSAVDTAGDTVYDTAVEPVVVEFNADDYREVRIDQDGDGYTVEEGDWCRDSDGDGYGDPSTRVVAGSMPEDGYVLNCQDCDDTSASINPTAIEIRAGFNTDGDLIDNDCDGLVDYADDDACGDSYLWHDRDWDDYGGEMIGLIRLCGTDMSLSYLHRHHLAFYAFDCDDADPRIQDCTV